MTDGKPVHETRVKRGTRRVTVTVPKRYADSVKWLCRELRKVGNRGPLLTVTLQRMLGQ